MALQRATRACLERAAPRPSALAGARGLVRWSAGGLVPSTEPSRVLGVECLVPGAVLSAECRVRSAEGRVLSMTALVYQRVDVPEFVHDPAWFQPVPGTRS